MVPAQTGQPAHPIPSFPKCQQKLLTSLSPHSIATSLTSKGLALPTRFNCQPSFLQPWINSVFPSGASSLEPETCFTEVRKELQTSPEPAASFHSLLPVVPASQNNLPSPSSPHSWHVKYCLVTEAQNDSNYSMNENNRAFYSALMTNINTTVCFGIFPSRLSWLSAKPLLSHS